jgi:hypothetical protein
MSVDVSLRSKKRITVHCRPPAHLLYWLQPARRPAGPKSLLVAFYGCINKSDKSLMLGPFMAFQPDCLIT